MTWIILSLIFGMAACCQFGVWRRWIRHRKNLKKPYLIICTTLWLIILMSIGLNAALKFSNPVLKLNGIAVVVFGAVTVLQAIFLVIDFVVRTIHGSRNATIILSGIFSLAAAGLVVWGATIGRSRVRIEQTEIFSDKIPESFDGLRIVLLSDMHTGMMFGRDKMLSQIVATVNELNPDLVVNCGDIVNRDHTELDETVLRLLSGIRSREGVVAVLGNHDLAISPSEYMGITPEEHAAIVTEKQRSINWSVLNDSTAFIVRGADSISITGVSYPEEIYNHSHRTLQQGLELSEAYAGANSGMYNITLSHAPQAWEAIKATGYGDLTLSGHVHSMQTKLKIGNWRWSPAALLYSNWSGRYDDADRTLYINDGIGSIFVPLRFGARPEITLIILRKQ